MNEVPIKLGLVGRPYLGPENRKEALRGAQGCPFCRLCQFCWPFACFHRTVSSASPLQWRPWSVDITSENQATWLSPEDFNVDLSMYLFSP